MFTKPNNNQNQILAATLFEFAMSTFFSCEKDDQIYNEPKQFGPSLEGPAVYLKGARAEEAIQLLNSSMSRVRREKNTGWTVDFEEILMVKDSLENKNFTFRVDHPDTKFDEFYNLVLTETSNRETSIKLVRYKMSASFAEKYSNGYADITEFEGTATFNPLKEGRDLIPMPPSTDDSPTPTMPAEPCEQQTIVNIGGGSSSGGGSHSGGGGGGGGGGYGNGGGVEQIVDFSFLDCFESIRIKCSEGNAHYGNPNSGCKASFKGATYLINTCTNTVTNVYGRNTGYTTMSDPCAPVGKVGVLFPLLNPFIIVEQIIDTDLDDCSKSVLSVLKNLEEVNMSAIISKLDASPSVYTATIKTESFGLPSPANTSRQTHPDGGFKRHDYIIRLNPDYVATANKLALANALLHEIIHAYFLTLVDDQITGSSPNALEDFPILFEAYVTKTFGPGAPVAHHIIMADKYVDVMARSLQEFQTGLSVAEGIEPDQIFKDLAWGGLQEAPVFQTLPQADRNRIINRYTAEWLNQTRGGQVPIGSPCN